MNNRIHHHFAGAVMALLVAFPVLAQAFSPNPDLTAAGAIAALKTDTNASPVYGQTYNLGATGLRGWIYINPNGVGHDGLQTDQSRQILVTVASTPANAVLAVDDVILGAMATNSGTVPLFSSDCRKAFGAAITDAEKTGAGTLRVKRWRAGVTDDVNIPMIIMGDYSTTAPYGCPKSSAILASARDRLVAQLYASSSFLSSDFAGAVSGLALLASVAPGYVHPTQPAATYSYVQSRLQRYASDLANAGPQKLGLAIWHWGYLDLFLAEYYLSTGDANVLPGINQYTLTLAKSQSSFGTFGHNPAPYLPDGSGRRASGGYGPINSAGVPANLAIFMGKKAMVAGTQAVDPEIDAAIQRGSNFFAWYANKGSIPYGEHTPAADSHATNGKDPMCAVFFGLQDNRLAEAEYFTRMSIAGFTGREYGHTGQGFSYLWGAMGANVGGSLATAEYLKKVRWHLDLERRTDGSFIYDGAEQYGAGTTSDGTYLGTSSYHGMNPTAIYILTYALPLQRLYITGKNANPANTLDSTKVAAALAAATFKQDCTACTNAQLFTYLGDFDPVVRNYAAIELAKRTLTSTELTTLRNMISGADANGRASACQVLGILKDAIALPLITQRLEKTVETDPWVRAFAAKALCSYTSTTMSTQRDPMLTTFIANATDPATIDWTDPLQCANGNLSRALFGNAVPDGTPGNDIQTDTINASKSLLYPAVRKGFKQPDSYPRTGASAFCYNRLPLADVQAMIADIFQMIKKECEVDRMWHYAPRSSGINTLAKYKISEGIPLALDMLNVNKGIDVYGLESDEGFAWGSDTYLNAALNVLATYGDAARWTLPTLRSYLNKWDTTKSPYTTLVNTIASLDAAITAPAQVSGSAVADSQLVVTTGAKAITLTGTSPRTAVTFINLTAPAHGTLTGTAPNLTYTPAAGYSGPDHFSFQTVDDQTTSDPGTVSIIVGTAGAGLKAEYFDNPDFTSLKLTRTDAQVNFDWGTGSPDPSVGADTFSARWSGQLLVPETGDYVFSTLNSDGVRLYINGVAVIDHFVDQSTEWNDGTPIHLKEGQVVEIQMEYYENIGSAVAKLKWTGPSFAGANGAIIAKEWLFDGSGVINRTPYAHSQTVATMKNSAAPINLTGGGGDTLTYTVISQPAHGTLTGIAPNLIYTPAANYSGPDSFTFLVFNGNSNSTPATVSISVGAGPPVTCTWAGTASGTWSTAANWTGGTAPDTTGQPFYNLNFAPGGTYTITHDLSSGFQLNQLNMAGNITLAGSNTLTFVANGTLPPQVSQNSANYVLINTPLNLVTTTSFGGLGTGQVDLGGLLSGAGGLIKDSLGVLKVFGYNLTTHTVVPNTYSGGTVVNYGTLHLGTMDGGTSNLCTNPAGTGTITLNGGTIKFDRVTANNALIINGGTFHSANGWGATLSGPATLNATTTADADYGLTFSGNISGAGGFTKTGANTLTLSGTNSFTGANKIQTGTLSCSQAAALGTGPLDITAGAKVALNFTGTRTIAALSFGGVALPPGTYGSTASTASNKNDTYFSGTGTITILPSTTTSLSLTGGSTPANVGTALTFTAAVSGTSPTGSVSFYANTTLLGTSTLNGSYQASLTTSSLAVGDYEITARYTGNASNATSTSPALTINVTNLLPPTPANPLALPGNNKVSLSWTLSSGATSYRVKRALTSGGPYTVIGNPANGNYTDTTVSNGTSYYYVISALNASGESADSNQLNAVPAPQSSITAITSSPFGISIYGDSVTFTATVSVSGAAATGMVTFMDGATVLGTGTLSGGVASLALSTLVAASHSITATYGGDDNYLNSVSSPLTYVVAPKPLSITGVIAANKTYDGTNTAALSGGTLNGGVVSGETVTIAPGSGSFASPNVGTWAVTASGYSLGGVNAGNYTLFAQPAVPNATITARPIQLSGTRPYDGTVTAQAGILAIANNVDGSNLTLSGSATLVGKDAGSQAIRYGFTTPVRVQTAKGSTGTVTTTNIGVTLAATPANGNTLIAVIATRGTISDRVSSITGGGVTWSRVTQATNASGITTEIWYGPGVSSGSKSITITQADLRSAAIVMEYSGLVAPVSTDVVANTTGNSTSPSTGTTASTAQSNELWIGGIGILGSTSTLSNITNSFFAVDNEVTTNATTNRNARVYALDRVVTGAGTASSGGTLSASAQWSGAIATFKAAVQTNLTLSGPAAANYTLTGMTGAVAITPKALTITADNQSKTYGQTVAFGSGATQFNSVGLQNNETIGSVTLTCTGSGAAAAGGTYPITPSAATGGTFTASNYAIQYVDGTLTVNMVAFEAWAADSAQSLTAGVNNGPLDDPDRDGISNLLEFTLGGNPMVPSETMLPTLTRSGNDWIFEYNRSELSRSPATTQVVEYGNDLVDWTQIAIPTTSAGSVTITPGSPFDRVSVTNPILGPRTFVRLKVTK